MVKNAICARNLGWNLLEDSQFDEVLRELVFDKGVLLGSPFNLGKWGQMFFQRRGAILPDFVLCPLLHLLLFSRPTCTKVMQLGYEFPSLTLKIRSLQFFFDRDRFNKVKQSFLRGNWSWKWRKKNLEILWIPLE